MTIIQKWRLMMSSFADIKAAIIEMGGTLPEGKGYNRYANAVRSIYSDTYTDEYEYPRNTVDPIKLLIPVAYALELVVWCKAIKEQIRQAIIDGNVECDENVPLSEYGNKIREISVEEGDLQILIPADNEIGVWDEPCKYQLKATGGKRPYTWSTDTWFLYGAKLNSKGTITGTPTMAGTSNNHVTVTDKTNKSVSATISLRILKKSVYLKSVGQNTFVYDGEPHTLNIVCEQYPDMEFEVYYRRYSSSGQTIGWIGEKTRTPTEVGTWYTYEIYIQGYYYPYRCTIANEQDLLLEIIEEAQNE